MTGGPGGPVGPEGPAVAQVPDPGRRACPMPTQVTSAPTPDGTMVALYFESANGTFVFAFSPDEARQLAHGLRETAKACRGASRLVVPGQPGLSVVRGQVPPPNGGKP